MLRQPFGEQADILVAFNKATTSEKVMPEYDLVFPHSYEVEGPPELPGSGTFDVPVLYFPPPKNRPDHNGLWLKPASSFCRIDGIPIDWSCPYCAVRHLGMREVPTRL